MKTQPVLIIWQDSATDHGWIEAEKDLSNTTVKTLGFLVAKTPGKRGVHRVAHSSDETYVNGTIDIPNVCILEYYDLDIDVLA